MMKKRLLLSILLICIAVLAFGLVTASAETYGDLTYRISDNEITITDCSTSATEVVIPDKIGKYPVTAIGDRAFYNCKSLTSVTIPDSVTVIESRAFYECSSLASVTMSESVTTIGSSAFAWCALTSIVIPESVTIIGSGAFLCCYSLKNVYITNLDKWYNIDFEGGSANPLSYAQHIYLNNELVEIVTIPDGVTSIGNYAFEGFRDMIKINIPESVTSIGDYAFSDCDSLMKITIPESVTSIGEGMFYNCDSLIQITLPDGVASIGWGAFYLCSSLKSITIPESVKAIGNSAFSYCGSLTSITIPDGVTSIGYGMFERCESLTSIIIPDSVKTIGSNAFANCGSLTSVNIPDGVTTIEGYTFFECHSLASITIPDSVRSIGDFAFYYCHKLTSIDISDGVTTIGKYAFSNCSSLTSVAIPDGVTSIGEMAFFQCGSLNSITISDSVISIGNSAFGNCYELTNVYISDLSAWCKIDFEVGFSNPLNYAKNLYLNNKLVEELDLSGVTGIEEYAFYGCDSIKSVVLPVEMRYIKSNAFYNCSNIETVFFRGSEAQWDDMLIYSGNESLTNANVVFNAKSKTYSFVTNCAAKLADVTAYSVASAPKIQNDDKNFIGWYDNKPFAGTPITFPYYGDATVLYAAWTDKTGLSFDDAFIAKANKSYTVTTPDAGGLIYYEFVPRITGEYRFYSTGSIDTYGYLYNGNRNQLTYNNNSGDGSNFYISYNLTAGETYYIAAECYSGSGTFTLVIETDCIEGTKTVYVTAVSGETIFTCIPSYLSDNCQIILACYKDGALCEVQHTQNRNETLYFIAKKEFDAAKIMVWNNLSAIEPVCDAEVVK